MNEVVEMQAAELNGFALDWATAYALNGTKAFFDAFGVKTLGRSITQEVLAGRIKPSQNWAQCGSLIENYGVCILQYHEDCHDLDKDNMWAACMRGADNYFEAPTPLIAACRAIVAAVLGETVSVPKELLPC